MRSKSQQYQIEDIKIQSTNGNNSQENEYDSRNKPPRQLLEYPYISDTEFLVHVCIGINIFGIPNTWLPILNHSFDRGWQP